MSNITNVVKQERNMTILNRGVLASGLDQILSGAGPFTLFAPSDFAFGKLETGILDTLLKPENKLKLADLLTYHVVAGRLSFKDLKDGDKLKTLNGQELSVSIKDNKVSIDGATIQNRDVPTSNGVIHSLDSVLKN
ncbi:MAG TPA: fasciclin domain-containing protein [Chitinophagaceae bacterium]|nr:fasciclin domain-containing protein [Chitinophagaceae bacterium]